MRKWKQLYVYCFKLVMQMRQKQFHLETNFQLLHFCELMTEHPFMLAILLSKKKFQTASKLFAASKKNLQLNNFANERAEMDDDIKNLLNPIKMNQSDETLENLMILSRYMFQVIMLNSGEIQTNGAVHQVFIENASNQSQLKIIFTLLTNKVNRKKNSF